jgi:hypothetical protein
LSGDRFATTSTSTYTLGAVGSSGTITVGTGLAYTVGQSIIVAYDANNHVEAEVTSYNPATGSLSFTVFRLTGSGTYSSWQVNLVGQAISEALLEKEAVPAPVEEEVPVSTE